MIKFTTKKLTRQNTMLLSAAASVSQYGVFNTGDFKGQSAVPHNPRNNRKTKKGGK